MWFLRCLVTAALSSLVVSGGATIGVDLAHARDAGAPSDVQAEVAEDLRAVQIRQLIDGTLDTSVPAESLFDVALSDEVAVQVELRRLRALLAAVSERPVAAPANTPTSASTTTSSAASATSTREAPSFEAASVANAASNRVAESPVAQSESWTRRLELDRARLEFYVLDATKRASILAAHAARRVTEREGARLPSDGEQALAAARAARAEAERLVAEEGARLAVLDDQVRIERLRYQERRGELGLRRDLVFGWQRRVRDAMSADAIAADSTYDAIARQLRGSREELVAALGELSAASDVPSVGVNVLSAIPTDISTDAVRERRMAVERAIAEAQREEVNLREERCAALLGEISALNLERLGLLPQLTLAKRRAVTGLTSAGLEQALAEAEHLSLILRYHQHVARRWLLTLRSGETAGVSPWLAAVFLVPLMGVLLVFVWGRRRIQLLLQLAEERLASSDRSQHRTTQSSARHFFRVLLGIHRPLEWMVLFTVVFELLPGSARDLVEVQLLSSVLIWFLMGALVVNTINALAAGRNDVSSAATDDGEAALRLRSLRFVGGTVVVFGLTLVLCARLVGEGTIYSWVSATAWLATMPVFLVLVRWWRGTVFQRLDRARKKTPLQAWILANRSGWQSFLAAMVGALQLFATGTLRTARSWLSDFDVARRVHAYLFKREIERLREGLTQLEPLSLATADILHPERPPESWIACSADVVRDAIERRCVLERGGVVAVHGARGMGKSSLLRTLAEQAGKGAVIVACTRATSIEDIRRAAHRVTGADAVYRVVLLDDAQALIEARIGGLVRFDEIIAWMRNSGDGLTWVIALDSTLWPLLQRARDSRPLFDECHPLLPWRENQIGELLAERCARAGVAPNYADLLDKLPPGADDIERQEALDAKRAGYQRMLWDHVGGNPGLALQAWRASLAEDVGGEVRVRSLQVPNFATLEALPDASLFVLRAVLQLEPAAVHSVAQATRLRVEEVLVDFRFGKSQGYFEDVEGGVRVAWPWLGAVTRLLERRRLLVVS